MLSVETASPFRKQTEGLGKYIAALFSTEKRVIIFSLQKYYLFFYNSHVPRKTSKYVTRLVFNTERSFGTILIYQTKRDLHKRRVSNTGS